MDAAGQYRKLLQLGRDEFLASAAPAVLVRFRRDDDDAITSGATTATIDDPRNPSEDTLPFGKDLPSDIELEIYPLAKKSGASFSDRITIGRTPNNDVVINDPSVSRLHAYVKRAGDAWSVTDAGSKNGSWLRGVALEPRKQSGLPPSAVLRFGEVDVTFYLARDLFAVLGGT
ncbi:MAG TPA: FHA domain-containing protein [Kofleriaceae bacterium]|nr:FHA domain-containing protein [Kofleriaceae bacterium]